MPKFVKSSSSDSICIQFRCNECSKQFITTIDDFSKSFVCSKCGAVVNTLPIFCTYDGCSGRYSYFRCNGTIRKLSGDEMASEEKKIFDQEQDISVGARPTDSFHDDISDMRASTISYKCDKCGDAYSLSQAVSKRLDSGHAKCERIVCDTCGRFPVLEGLPGPDADVDNSPLKRIYYN